MKKKALIAMSGGVDSSVAAHLVREAGYDITGATMKLYDNEMIGLEPGKKCGSTEGIKDARAVAERLGIDFHVCDLRDEFKCEVIGRFIDDYEHGRTPNPCVDCNRELKFNRLYDYGRSLGYEYIATGHYVQVEYCEETGRYLLRKSENLAKDQSYFLYSLTQEQLAHAIFPLGGMTKDDTRELARELGLEVAEKKESQDICFVPGGDYVGFIRQFTGREYEPGDFVDAEGNVLGEHKGIIKYTIGQRKGLGLALKKPMYVTTLDMENNRVILGDNEDLFTRELEAKDMNWIAYDIPPAEFRASARIRYKHREAPATIIPLGDGRARIVFDEPQRAVTSGQSVVIYDGDYVVGGGKII